MVGGHADLNILAATEIFRFLPVETVEEARSLAVRKRIAKRTVLYHQGDAADTFYVVIVGRLRAIQTEPDGTQLETTALPSR